MSLVLLDLPVEIFFLVCRALGATCGGLVAQTRLRMVRGGGRGQLAAAADCRLVRPVVGERTRCLNYSGPGVGGGRSRGEDCQT